MDTETLLDRSPESKPTMPQLVESFLTYLKTERDASPHTLLNYEIDLRHWIGFHLKNHGGAFDLNELASLKNLREFLSAEGEKYERSTIARRLSVIKGFLKHLHREGILDKNLAKLISLPRPEEKLPGILKPEQAIQMIEAMPTNTLREKRLRAAAELLYSTGIRISELVGLNRGDIDLREGTLKVMGKGSKERIVPMGQHCQTAIRDYIDSVPAIQSRGAETPLFLNEWGERVSVRTLQRNLKTAALDSLGTLGINVSPHTLRHSCATHLLAGGAGLREIQELLGHRSLVTTQKYTQVDVERLKASYKKAHPKERARKKETGSA
jgi:integrase/recombinase XerC